MEKKNKKINYDLQKKPQKIGITTTLTPAKIGVEPMFSDSVSRIGLGLHL
jgi:hypothetical protein